MVFLCFLSSWSVSDFADISNIFIAIFNLFLAGYIFIYQRDKDRASKVEALTIEERNIRLQWFKELIIQPNLNQINTFYSNLHDLEAKFASGTTIDDTFRISISDYIKNESSVLRKSFYDILRSVNSNLHCKIESNIDNLIDNLISQIFNPGLNLNHKPTFNKEITSLISYSKNDLISVIYNYKGI